MLRTVKRSNVQPMTKPDIIGTQKLIFGNDVHLSVNIGTLAVSACIEENIEALRTRTKRR